MAPEIVSSVAAKSSQPVACGVCGQLLYADQPMVTPEVGRALHIGCHRLAAIQRQHGPGPLVSETLPRLAA